MYKEWADQRRSLVTDESKTMLSQALARPGAGWQVPEARETASIGLANGDCSRARDQTHVGRDCLGGIPELPRSFRLQQRIPAVLQQIRAHSSRLPRGAGVPSLEGRQESSGVPRRPTAELPAAGLVPGLRFRPMGEPAGGCLPLVWFRPNYPIVHLSQ